MAPTYLYLFTIVLTILWFIEFINYLPHTVQKCDRNKINPYRSISSLSIFIYMCSVVIIIKLSAKIISKSTTPNLLYLTLMAANKLMKI